MIEDLCNGITLELVKIPAGTFLMGSSDIEADQRPNEMPQHLVQVGDFWMGKYPVTQRQWRVVATTLPRVERGLDRDPSYFEGDLRPVEAVSWHDAVEFCARVSAYTKCNYRLPTEAEWEYACRAGTTTPFYFGEKLEPGMIDYNREQGTTDVGSFPANALGLHDMHGNVWEWCTDHWHATYTAKPDELRADGSIPWTSGNEFANRLLRGGSWFTFSHHCRSAIRNYNPPDATVHSVGFRVAFSPK